MALACNKSFWELLQRLKVVDFRRSSSVQQRYGIWKLEIKQSSYSGEVWCVIFTCLKRMTVTNSRRLSFQVDTTVRLLFKKNDLWRPLFLQEINSRCLKKWNSNGLKLLVNKNLYIFKCGPLAWFYCHMLWHAGEGLLCVLTFCHCFSDTLLQGISYGKEEGERGEPSSLEGGIKCLPSIFTNAVACRN